MYVCLGISSSVHCVWCVAVGVGVGGGCREKMVQIRYVRICMYVCIAKYK